MRIDIIVAFLKKDFRLKKSYRFSFFWGIFSSFFSLLIFYFIDLLMEGKITSFLAPYGVNYFNYVFLGIIIYNFSQAGPGSITQKIYEEKICGTLEEILRIKSNIPVFLFSVSFYNFILSLAEATIYLFAGLFIFKVDFSCVNWVSVFVIMFFSFFSFSSIGILSSCFILLFKRGNPIAFLFNSAEGFLGGVYFPVNVLPFGLYKISYALPIYWVISAAQKAFYRGASVMDIWLELAVLACFSLFLLPISFWCFNLACNYAKRMGCLNQF